MLTVKSTANMHITDLLNFIFTITDVDFQRVVIFVYVK
jgi:hypothetical protein